MRKKDLVLPVGILAGEIDNRQIKRLKRRNLVWLMILLQYGCSAVGWSEKNGQYHVIPKNRFVLKKILRIINRFGFNKGLWTDGMIYFDFDLEDFNFEEQK